MGSRAKNEVEVSILIGDIYDKNHDLEKSLIFYKGGLRTASDEKTTNFQITDTTYAKLLLRVGAAYHKLSIIDSAKLYYKKLDKINSLSSKVIGWKATSYNNLSAIYQKDSMFVLSEKYALKSLKIHISNNDKVNQARTFSNLGSLNLSQSKFDKSKDYYLKGIKVIKNINTVRAQIVRSDLYYNLAWTMRNLEKYEAYDNLEIAYDIKDSLRNDKIEKELAHIQGGYNVSLIRKEEELKRQKTIRNTWVLGISSVSIIIVLTFLLNQYKLRQKNLRLALSQKETESQMEILNANLTGQEAERKRISQELHDGVLSRLFGSRMGLGYLELDSDKETQSQYQKYLEELQSIEKEIREVSHQLSSDVSLSETSFLNAINQLLKEKSGLGNFEFQLKMDDSFSWKELDGVLEMNLFRILQESLQNILKHAQAKNVFVSFKVEKQKLLLEIKDDGVGYDTKKKTKGIGLKNIKSRVKNMKGSIQVSSELNEGVLMKISLPIS